MRTLALAQVSILALVSAVLLATPSSGQQSIAPPPTAAPPPGPPPPPAPPRSYVVQPDASLIWEAEPPLGALSSFRVSDYRMIVELRCLVASGALTECAPVVETPQTFLDAAVISARAARLAPLDRAGQPTEGREIVVRVMFPIPVSADPPPAPPAMNILGAVTWLEQPQPEQFRLYYPQQAFHENVEGRATLDCLVDGSGRLSCNVTNEEPVGYGFGDAALRISRHFRVAPETQDGRSTAGARIRRTIRFALS